MVLRMLLLELLLALLSPKKRSDVSMEDLPYSGVVTSSSSEATLAASSRDVSFMLEGRRRLRREVSASARLFGVRVRSKFVFVASRIKVLLLSFLFFLLLLADEFLFSCLFVFVLLFVDMAMAAAAAAAAIAAVAVAVVAAALDSK